MCHGYPKHKVDLSTADFGGSWDEMEDDMGEERGCDTCRHDKSDFVLCDYVFSGSCEPPDYNKWEPKDPVAQPVCARTEYCVYLNELGGSIKDCGPKCVAYDPVAQPDNTQGAGNKRGRVLSEALDIINGERQDDYGNPEDSFEIIADYWTAFINGRFPGDEKEMLILTSLDVANMMVLFKQARKLGQKPCIDNYRDAAGYEGIGGDMVANDIAASEA